jgi:predicted RNA-binding protein associated with RNAse of E/G family
MSERIVVHKLDADGNEVWRYEGMILAQDEVSLTLEAYFDHEDMFIHGVDLRRGDRFVEIYYTDRWYNILALYDVESGDFKGWYCNITRPAHVETGHVYYEDLALDLIVLPSGDWLVLDEEQFTELDLPPDERYHAREGLEELKTLIARRQAPFQRLGGQDAHR